MSDAKKRREQGAARRGRTEDDKTEQILRSAATLFVERGYSQTSIRAIAESVGLLPGSLYYYVDTKEDLFYRVLRRQHENLLRMWEQQDQAEPPFVRIRHFIERHLEFMWSPVGQSASYKHDFRILGEEQKESIRALRREYEMALATLIIQGQEAEVVCPDIDPLFTSRALLSFLNSLQRRAGAAPADTARMRDKFSDMCVMSIACDRSTHMDGHRSLVAREE